MKKNCLMLTAREMSGESTGRKSVLKTAHRSLCKIYDEVHVIDIGSYCRMSLPLQIFVVIKNLLLHFVFSGWSFNECIFYSGKKARKIVEFVEKSQIDFIYVDTIRLLPYLVHMGNLKGVVVHMDFDDRYSRRYFLMGRSANEFTFGKVVTKFPGVVRSIARVLAPIVIRIEAVRVYKREKLALLFSSSQSFVSQREAVDFNRDFSANAAVLPMSFPVNRTFFGERSIEYFSGEDFPRAMKLLFVGDMRYQGNIDSIDFILEHYPSIVAKYGLTIAGAFDEGTERLRNNDRLDFLGYVDDLGDLADKFDIMFVPMASPGGIKTKVLEGFSLGIPVITNLAGVDGLDVDDGVQLFICDNDAECFNVFSSFVFRTQLGSVVERANDFLRSNFSHEIIEARWLDIINSLGVEH